MTSGRGGAGKSTVCGCLGVALAARGKRVLLVETHRRALDLLLGVADKVVYDLRDLMEERCVLRDAVLAVEGHPNLRLLAGPLSGEFLPDARLFADLEEETRREFDYIFIEAQGFDGALAAAAPVCTGAVIVAAADPVSARESRGVSDRLAGLGLPFPRLCINQLARDFAKKRPVPDLDFMIDSICAQLISVILWDSAVQGMQGIQEMTYMSKTTRIIFDNFAQRIMGNDIDLLVR